MTLSKSLLLPTLLASLIACAPGADSDIPFEGDATPAGKADAVGIDFTPVSTLIDFDRLNDGGKAIITSADSWTEYFGTDAPSDIDFDSEWVAFFGSGLKNTGGFSAEIVGISQLASGGLVLETLATSPGFDCIVTQALTTPHSIVKFDIPAPTPRFAVSDHSDEVVRCGPSNDDRRAELAESLKKWEAARDEAGSSYNYTRVTSSFFANMVFRTTFIVEAGVVVERVATSAFNNEDETVDFREIGDEVGANQGVHAVALIDDLYAQCKDEVLSKDEDEHFINLRFLDGYLQSCTATHRLCQDDCSRGPVIEDIEF